MMAATDTLEEVRTTADVLRDLGMQRQRFEQELSERGVPLPLPHRLAWARAFPAAGSWFVAVGDSDGKCLGGFAVEVQRSRALPGHLLMRVERFGGSMPPVVRKAGLDALVKLATSERRVLRVNIETFCPEASEREQMEQELRELGFEPARARRRYNRTISVDLTPDEEGILASFQGSARRHIRAIDKHPAELKPVDLSLIARLDQLYAETMTRTEGACRPRDWAAMIRLSQEHPELCRITGLFRTEMSGPDALLAFACGLFHGDYAHYDAAASTRATDLKMPLAYAPIWDLMRWTKQNGGRWFDFGGVTEGRHGDGVDRLGGISDFKRHFSKTVVDVGGEWELEPHEVRARLARAVSRTAAWFSRVRAR